MKPAAQAPPSGPKRVLVAMSGGVDSSVAAAALVEAGHEVVGATLKTFCYAGAGDHGKTCCGLEGIRDARSVADRLGVPHYVFDVEEDFTHDVIDDFVAEYARGRTPNPCVRCNTFTKFRDLARRGAHLGCDAIATGHYVRVAHGPDGSSLYRGRDREKDQSYFLWGLPREVLPHLLFPLGDTTKPEVRARALSLGLVTAEKPESQEICFVPTGDYRDLLRTRLPPRHPSLQQGPLVTLDGSVVGRHQGYAFFTVGQRKGLGGGFAEPAYVVEIRPETREVVVGPLGALTSEGLILDTVNWLAPPPRAGTPVQVQIRHGAPGVQARVASHPGTGLELHLEEPQRAVTPGQSGVVFDGDHMLGGGRIVRALRGAPRPDQSSGAARPR